MNTKTRTPMWASAPHLLTFISWASHPAPTRGWRVLRGTSDDMAPLPAPTWSFLEGLCSSPPWPLPSMPGQGTLLSLPAL